MPSTRSGTKQPSLEDLPSVTKEPTTKKQKTTEPSITTAKHVLAEEQRNDDTLPPPAAGDKRKRAGPSTSKPEFKSEEHEQKQEQTSEPPPKKKGPRAKPRPITSKQDEAIPKPDSKSTPAAKTTKGPRAKARDPSSQSTATKAETSNDIITKANQPSHDPRAPKVAKEHEDDVITINRAPVLHLWAAVVAGVVYDEPAKEQDERFRWETCLSAGAAVAALCAVSKGRAIGLIGGGEENEEQDRKKEREKEKMANAENMDVMGFHLPLNKDGLVLVGGKPKQPGEEGLIKKFGEEEKYGRAKNAMREAAETWQGHEEELQKKAFHFYEKFRPAVDSGQAGWGRRGTLDLENMKKVVQRVETGQVGIEEAMGKTD